MAPTSPVPAAVGLLASRRCSGALRISRYCIASPRLTDVASGIDKRLLFSTRTGQVRSIDEVLWSALEEGRMDAIPASILEDLVDLEVVVSCDENELATIVARNWAAVRDEDAAYVVVQPTAQCQLACDYCGQKHSAQRLSVEHQRLLVARVREKLRHGGYKTLDVHWFGAEALLALDVLQSLTTEFRSVAAEFNASYRSSMTTNGFGLTPAVASMLTGELGIHLVEVTLDGDATDHDRRRYSKGGAPTFERIFENLVALGGDDYRDLDISIRCNVDARNAGGVIPLLRRLAGAGLQSRIVHFNVHPVHAWGNDADRLALPPAEFARLEVEWFVEMVRLGFEVGLVPPRKPITCMAVRPDAMLVDPRGALFNCTQTSLVPGYEVVAENGEIDGNAHAIGHLETGEDAARRERLGGFMNRIALGELECHSCALLPVCGGACPKQWADNKSPCPSYKHNIGERLLLSYAIHRLETGARARSPVASSVDASCA